MACSWTLAEEVLTVESVVPPNTTAEVRLPDGTMEEIGSGQHRWEIPSAHTADPGPLTLGEVADRSGGLKLLANAIIVRVPNLADFIKVGMGSIDPKTTVREALMTIPGPGALPEDVHRVRRRVARLPGRSGGMLRPGTGIVSRHADSHVDRDASRARQRHLRRRGERSACGTMGPR